jgi:hypothetical protein
MHVYTSSSLLDMELSINIGPYTPLKLKYVTFYHKLGSLSIVFVTNKNVLWERGD